MSDWPRAYNPIEDGVVDTTTTVLIYPHMPAQTDVLAAWCEENGSPSEQLFINGGPVLLLHNTRQCSQRLAGLGDIVVKPEAGALFAFPGGELGGRYLAADHVGFPPGE